MADNDKLLALETFSANEERRDVTYGMIDRTCRSWSTSPSAPITLLPASGRGDLIVRCRVNVPRDGVTRIRRRIPEVRPGLGPTRPGGDDARVQA